MVGARPEWHCAADQSVLHASRVKSALVHDRLPYQRALAYDQVQSARQGGALAARRDTLFTAPELVPPVGREWRRGYRGARHVVRALAAGQQYAVRPVGEG